MQEQRAKKLEKAKKQDSKQELGKKQTKLGIDTPKEKNYSEWYSQVNF